MDQTSPETTQPTVLERLDLALAGRIVERLTSEDNRPDHLASSARWVTSADDRIAWAAGIIALRGLRVTGDEVRAMLAGLPNRFRPEHQEHKLVIGLWATLDELESRGAKGQPPDGWWLVEMFRRTTEQVGRFRNNVLRRDEPWDSIPAVVYPRSDSIQSLVDRFHVSDRFGDREDVFESLHPVRQGIRLTWRFARMAPFPDLNLSFAMVALCAWLRAFGYPLLIPEFGDRTRIERTVRGKIPLRMVPLEFRLLDTVLRASVPKSS